MRCRLIALALLLSLAGWPQATRAAEEPPLLIPEVAAGQGPRHRRLPRRRDLLRHWDRAGDDQERNSAWAEMLAIHADQVFSIGLVGELAQPVVTDARLRNLPSKAYFMNDPGAYFGLTRPDTYFF